MTLVPYPDRSAQARRRLRTLMMALLVGGLLSVSGSAFAQDAPETADAPEEVVDAPDAPEDAPATPEESDDSEASDQPQAVEASDTLNDAEQASDASAESAPAPTGAPAVKLSAGDRSAIESRMDSYWSVEKELPSIEHRKYTREGRFSAGLYAGILASQPFYWYIPVGLRATYYFSNTFGVGVEGSFTDAPDALSHNTELSDYLEGERPSSFTDAKKEDRFLWRAHAVATWHPLYGKLAFLQRKLTHFDLNLVGGAGVVSVERPNVVRTEVSSAISPEVLLGGGLEVFITENVTARLDGRFYIYKAAETDQNGGDFFKSLEVPAEFLLGVSYIF